jgi:DNA-binding NarL/FixJ family response regulator
MLSNQPDFEVVAEAADGWEALELCRRLKPDLVLMDVRMPTLDGIEATRAIKAELAHTSVLMLTSHENHNYLLEALKAGAAGYVLKDVGGKQLCEAIRATLSGESPLNGELAKQLLMRLVEQTKDPRLKEDPSPSSRSPQPQPSPSPPPIFEVLTPREGDVLRLLVKGEINQEIARSLLISVSAVKKHVRQIIRKLGVSDRTQAVVKAIEMGLQIEPERD